MTFDIGLLLCALCLQLKQALSPVKQNLESLFQQINTAIAQGPELALPIRRYVSIHAQSR